MSAADEPANTCYRWSRDFIVAHAVVASGLVTAPVAVLLLAHRPRSGKAIFFAAFAAFCTAVSLVLCIRFYADLRRPPWPRWLWPAGAGGQHQEDGGEVSVVVVDEHVATAARETSHAVRHAEEQPATRRAEVQAAMAAGLIPSYEHVGDEAAEDCAVCLGEVEKGETVRRLPSCRHLFHRECIDVWLRAHATCPVCRSGVLPAAAAAERAAVEEVVVHIGAVHGQPIATMLTPPGIVLAGRTDQGFWFGSVSRLR